MRRSKPEPPRKRVGGLFDDDPAAEAAGDAAGESPYTDDEHGPTRAGTASGSTAEDAADCERRAVALLARREHSRLELGRKLSARGYPPALVAETLDGLEQNGLLSGQRFISGFISSRAGRGSGPAKIRAELVQRGIRPDEAAAAIRAADEDWVSLARRVRTKRFGTGPPRDFAERARQARFLRGRGFDAEHVDAALEVGADSD